MDGQAALLDEVVAARKVRRAIGAVVVHHHHGKVSALLGQIVQQVAQTRRLVSGGNDHTPGHVRACISRTSRLIARRCVRRLLPCARPPRQHPSMHCGHQGAGCDDPNVPSFHHAFGCTEDGHACPTQIRPSKADPTRLSSHRANVAATTPGRWSSNTHAAAASRTPSSAGQGMDPTAHQTAAMRGNPWDAHCMGWKTFQAESISKYWKAKVA